MTSKKAIELMKALIDRLRDEGVTEENDAIVAEITALIYDTPMLIYWIPASRKLATDNHQSNGNAYSIACAKEWAIKNFNATSFRLDHWNSADAVPMETRWWAYDKHGDWVGTLRILPKLSLGFD